VAPAVRIGKHITDLMGVTDDPRWMGNWSTVQQWLNEGFGESAIILTATDVVKRLKASGRSMPGSLNYFTKAIRATTPVKPVASNGEFIEVKRGTPAFRAWVKECKQGGKKTQWLEKQDSITIPSEFVRRIKAAERAA
jgi:hypothetical protein